jgi:hypothetical protein
MNQTAAELESQPLSITDLIENISPNDLSGSDISDLINLLEYFPILGDTDISGNNNNCPEKC